jgi:hypothetical protein
MRLNSPYKFKERLLLFGGGGVGKTNACLTIARAMPTGTMFVIDNDMSFAWSRALDTEFDDMPDGRVDVREVDPDWRDVTDTLAAVLEVADPDTDWIVVDSITPTWDYVQTWLSEQVHGTDLAGHMAKLRAEAADIKEFNKELTSDMTWPLIKREYQQRIYRPLQKWRGHLILTAEGAEVGRFDNDEAKALYGHLGFKPKGEGRLHHVTSTTLFLTKVKETHRFTTVKDRNRDEMERAEWDDFAMDYLRDVGGWRPIVKKKAATQEAEGE